MKVWTGFIKSQENSVENEITMRKFDAVNFYCSRIFIRIYSHGYCLQMSVREWVRMS